MKTFIKYWQWNFAAGFVPLFAGFFLLITSYLSESNAQSKWNLVLGKLDFSYQNLVDVSEHSGVFVKFLASLSSVNIVIGAFSVIMISYFALRTKQKWAWWFILIALVWLGGNDAYGGYVFFKETGIPLFIMPFTFCALMIIGLVMTKKQIFNQDDIN